MKKVLCLLISLVLFIPVNIYGKNVDLREINLTIDFNDDWYVFTRYNLDGNKDLETLGVTKDYMENFFNENEAYIDASPKELGTDFILRIKPVEDMNNLSNYPDDVVKEVAKEISKLVSSEDYKVYNNGKTKYAVVKYYDEASKYNILTYYTVVNAQGYTFQIQKQSDITQTDETNMKTIMDSATFNVLDKYKNESEDVQKELDKDIKKDLSFKNILIYAGVGALIGIISILISNKKKNKKGEI